MNHFKTQQEIWKYVADGGAVVSDKGDIVKFSDGKLTYDWSFSCPSDWKLYIEPVAKTKVWRWETIQNRDNGDRYLNQTNSLLSEKHAAEKYPGSTKVPGSEREI